MNKPWYKKQSYPQKHLICLQGWWVSWWRWEVRWGSEVHQVGGAEYKESKVK